ncbi:hypothetical protein CcaCcLH18_13217 [Colletotrichum camelliae]|nr:hypothetical protein CcaCcLH18_13217 [Colletotrichum camelliae]
MAYARPDYESMWRQELYLKVYTHDVETNTNAYWAFESQRMYPMEQGFLVNREENPDHGNLKFDRVVSEMLPTGQVRKVITGEDKRLGVSKGNIVKAENDVEAKSLLAMDQDGTSAVYCQTTRATMFRTWVIRNPARRLEPLFGPNTRGDLGEYVDIRTSFGQYQWHRLGSLVKNEPEVGLDNFQFQFQLTAGPVWDQRHQDMQIRLETKHAQAEADQLYEQEQLDATFASQVTEEVYEQDNSAAPHQSEDPGTAMHVDNDIVEHEPADRIFEAQPPEGQSDYHDPGQSYEEQEQPAVQTSSASASTSLVTLSYHQKKGKDYFTFQFGNRNVTTTPSQWSSAHDEDGQVCYQWQSNTYKKTFRTYDWPQ